VRAGICTHLVNADAVLLICCAEGDRWYDRACLLVWDRSDMDRTSAKAMRVLLLDEIDRMIEPVNECD